MTLPHAAWRLIGGLDCRHDDAVSRLVEEPMVDHEAEAAVVGALGRLGLLAPGEVPRFVRLTGGVSSDIWRIDLARGPVCVKRALARLRVAADWRVPIERNAYEAAWMRCASAVVPEAVPALLGQDPSAGVLVMAYLPESRYPVWKRELRAGRAAPQLARAVGERLVRIHAGTAGDATIAGAFPTDPIFYDIRLEPYLVATARAHPDRAEALHALVETTAATRAALVHGDVSPKNILVGPDGPVFLDAECAWYGDPAFDLAFCLNHLLLKCVWRPASAAGYVECFAALARAYRAGVAWEDPAAVEGRTARLLPGLLLARIDGKSPVEYITAESDKNMVRNTARWLLASPVDRLPALVAAWRTGLAAAR
jgi:aminoglycoside phosphotransferase (APT) family kinase protein